MKTDTKIELISSIFSIAFLIVIVVISSNSSNKVNTLKDPFYEKFDNGYESEWANSKIEGACKKINSILGLELDYKDIEIRITKDLDCELDNFQYARALNNKIIINENFPQNGNLIMFNSNEQMFLRVLNHELIHIYVERFYPEEHKNMNNQNHIGVFEKWESELRKNGIPLAESYCRKHKDLIS